jgi:hypothetical protein
MLSDMTLSKLERIIQKIKKDIPSLGPLRPGTLYESHSVCGKPGCRCRREKNPVKHGPYHYLSYTFQGKSYTEFVTKEKVKAVREEVRNYKKLIELVKRLIDYSIKLARLRKTS